MIRLNNSKKKQYGHTKRVRVSSNQDIDNKSNEIVHIQLVNI